MNSRNSNSSLGLARADLVKQAGLIDGEWVQADGGRTVDVTDPATGRAIITVRTGGDRENMNTTVTGVGAKGVPGVTLRLSSSATNPNASRPTTSSGWPGSTAARSSTAASAT